MGRKQKLYASTRKQILVSQIPGKRQTTNATVHRDIQPSSGKPYLQASHQTDNRSMNPIIRHQM